MSEFEQIELDIKQAKELVARGESLNRLRNNQDFRDVITEGYFVDEAVRLVHLKCAPAMQHQDKQEGINKAIDAIGELSQYFSKLITQAEMAKSAIDDSEEELSAMAQEGAL